MYLGCRISIELMLRRTLVLQNINQHDKSRIFLSKELNAEVSDTTMPNSSTTAGNKNAFREYCQSCALVKTRWNN